MSNAKFSSASDVWSYGVTIWEIYSLGKTPWKGVGPLDIRDKVMDGERLEKPKRCPEEVFNVMIACWKKEPLERPTFVDILKRVKQLVPKQVRAIKAHTLRDDPSSLSFKTGDLIYVIDRPSADWISGMKTDGSVGHFKAEFVDDVLAPLDDLRASVEGGKPVSRLSISSPTDVDHMIHVNPDGTKWISDNARTMDFSPPYSPIRMIPPEEQSFPFRVVDNRKGVKSPNRRVSTGASDKANAYTYPDPMGWEDPDEHPKNSQELPTPDADNQYVSMTRTGMLSPTQKEAPSQQVGEGGAEGAEGGKDKSQGEGDTYITMTSFSVRTQGKMNRQQSNTLPRSGTSSAKLKKDDYTDLAELDLNPSGNNPPGRSQSVSNAPVHQRVNGQQPLPVDENSDSDVFLPVSATGGLVEGDSPPSSHYNIPRPALSASHYDRPRSAVVASQGITNDYQPSPLSSLNRNDSLLDTPNYSADTGPLLPEPLSPESSPSPTKASSRRHSDPHVTPLPASSNRTKKKKKRSDFVELKFQDDRLLFEGRHQTKAEAEEAIVPRSTRYLYSTASVGQNSSATVAAAAAASGRPIPKPRAGNTAAATRSLGNESLMDLLGQALGTSPPVPTRRRKPPSEGPSLPGIVAEDDREGASTSATTAASNSSHYQPLLHPGSDGGSAAGNIYQPLNVHTRSPNPPSNHQISSTNSSTQANSTYQPLSPTTLDRVADEYVKIDPTTRRVQPMGSRGRTNTEDQSSQKPAIQPIGPRERSSTEKPSQNSPTVPRDRSRTENKPTENGRFGETTNGSKLGLRVQQDKEEVLESILVEEEFSGCEVDMCRFALEQHNYDTEKAREEIRVQILLGMLLPNIREQDCRRALQHCQHKTNRAAVWLLQQSEDIERKAQ